MLLENVTVFCFAASYAVALLLELFQFRRPNAALRWVTYLVAAAGLLAHTLYLAFHGSPLRGGSMSLLFLSWILAVFYLYGSIHHRRQAWGIFVLPVVVILVSVAGWGQESDAGAYALPAEDLERLWIFLHVALLVLAAVGVCVGFVASVMYLTQSWRLKHKAAPADGLRLLSLERLEAMNRRAINAAFPLLTLGLLIGLFLPRGEGWSWLDPKVLSTAILWLVFVLLLYLRYGLHLQGRRVAIWTIAAFACLLVAFTVHLVLPSWHHFGGAS